MIWGSFWQIVDQAKKLISDFEKLVTNADLPKTLPHIQVAYIDSILVHVAKIFSDSSNESFRLGQFKTICRAEIKKELEDVENKYKDVIGKIITNRNKLVAHLDKNFYELPFSENEIIRMEKDMSVGLQISMEEAKSIYASMPRTTDKRKERYSTNDFHEDFPKIREMVEKVNEIWSRSIPFVGAVSN